MWRDNLFLRSLLVTLVLLDSPLIIAAGIGIKQAATRAGPIFRVEPTY
jgi:hypothetical protein